MQLTGKNNNQESKNFQADNKIQDTTTIYQD